MSAPLGRRPVLLTGVAALATSGLVACGSDDEPATGADGGDTGADTGSDSGSEGSGALVAADEVPVGGAVAAGSEDEPVIVAQPTEGEFVAFTAVCTHKGCTVAPEGAQLKCPCHGSVFDAFTGENLEGPAPSPLDSVSVTVEDGQVMQG